MVSSIVAGILFSLALCAYIYFMATRCGFRKREDGVEYICNAHRGHKGDHDFITMSGGH